MSSPKKEGLGKLIAEHPLFAILGVISSCLAIFTFFTNIQSIQEINLGGGTASPQPSPTPDLANLHTFFPHPTTNSSKTFNFNYIFGDYNQDTGVLEQKTDSGSYIETISIVNDEYVDKNITIVGVQVTNQKYFPQYVPHCPNNFYWYVYDNQRLYTVCEKEYVYFAASEMASNNAPHLLINSQFKPEPLNLYPEYLMPFEVEKQWDVAEYSYPATVKGRVSKTVSAGAFNDCFQISFFAINYNELRYLCPNVGLVAIEVNDHQEFYSAELAGIQK